MTLIKEEEKEEELQRTTILLKGTFYIWMVFTFYWYQFKYHGCINLVLNYKKHFMYKHVIVGLYSCFYFYFAWYILQSI